MNAAARRELWGRLQVAGLVTGELPIDMASPWYIKAMQGIAGWIGAFFLLGFLALGFNFLMDSVFGAVFAAAACSGGAYAIFSRAKGDFFGQFGLAVGLAGQVLFGVAIANAGLGWESLVYIIFCCVEAALTLLIPNFVYRICSTLGGVGALYLALVQPGLFGVALPLTAAACAWVWRGELRLAARSDLWQPVGYGLAFGVLLTAGAPLFGDEMKLFHQASDGWLQLHAPQISTALVACVLVAVVDDILSQLGIERSGREGGALLACTLLVLACSFPAHGLAAALLILFIGFAGGNRVLFGLGCVALASFLARYYFQMHETLLFKSMILGGTGLCLMLVRFGLGRAIPVREVARHA